MGEPRLLARPTAEEVRKKVVGEPQIKVCFAGVRKWSARDSIDRFGLGKPKLFLELTLLGSVRVSKTYRSVTVRSRSVSGSITEHPTTASTLACRLFTAVIGSTTSGLYQEISDIIASEVQNMAP